MHSEKDYAHKGWIFTLVLIAVLVGVTLIPPQSIGGVSLRRANILSDLIRFEDAVRGSSSQVPLDDEDFHIDMRQVAEQIVADTLPATVETTFRWQIGADTTALRNTPHAPCDTPSDQITPIEHADTTDYPPLRTLCEKLLDGKPVRIAVLGDSFIEGDILTADLRERLQELYGGSGAGFAPIASPLTGFRRTVKTQSKGWTSYNIMQHRTTPVDLRDYFYISGWICCPEPGAQTRWDGSTSRRHLTPHNRARVLFMSRRDSRVEVAVNDTLRHTFAIKGDASLRQIVVEGAPIHSLTFRMVEGTDGFIGYGALLDGDGIGVDNYSIRSNNGQAMFRTSPMVNAQANAMLEYDLIILQYGLNIMQQGIRNYTNYGAQIGKMIAFVRECFPTATILVMGVSDRSTRTDNGFQPMDALPHMIDCQREAAFKSGALFWDTASAMRSMGGMERFVANGWAGKDYTHINYSGGARVAGALTNAIRDAVCRTAQIRNSEQQHRRLPMGDSLRMALPRQPIIPTPLPTNR